MVKQTITLYLDPDPGITLKLLYDICVFAEENYKELRGIRPLQRVEAGIGFPKRPGDEQTYYKAKLLLGWNRGRSVPQYCMWNLFIPNNWKDELPRHRLFLTSINNKRLMPSKEPTSKDGYQAFLDWKRSAWDQADAFAWCQGEGIDIRKNKVIVTLDCSYETMPPKMFKAFKDALSKMGLCDKQGFKTTSHKALFRKQVSADLTTKRHC